MINLDTFAASPEIQQLITLLKTDQGYDYGRNQRRSRREPIVCPVTVQFQYELNRHRAFSKDISLGGICIIGERNVDVEQIATLTIYRTDGLKTKVRARCVWCSEFGSAHFRSGWNFLRKCLQ